MSDKTEGFFSCRNMCWIIGALFGIAAYLIALRRFDLGWLVALVALVAVTAVVGLILLKLFCEEAAVTVAADSGADAEPSGGGAVGEPAPTAVAKAAEPAPVPAKTAEAPAEAAPAAKPKRAPVARDGKPETLSAPRDGAGDDLKMIKGVGPQLEKTLNELGFWHYDQIAGWRKKEIEWVDERLKFKGRIERDDWIKQAKVLAKGGTTEFSARASKGGTYKKK